MLLFDLAADAAFARALSADLDRELALVETRFARAIREGHAAWTR